MQGFCGAVVSSGLGRFKHVWRGGISNVFGARLDIEDLLTKRVVTGGGASVFADVIAHLLTSLILFLFFSRIWIVFGFSVSPMALDRLSSLRLSLCDDSFQQPLFLLLISIHYFDMGFKP